ncbi:rod-binding protein [Sporanaerobacter acetigenes]|uniref:Flagellar protein FlgJ n=1 Tax=Sporanaerobacter acetigenes DSM 13106 TaxID=1123281 RepID=A0A1M5SV55_9FIRM|nr:rod-binding protein [Sporanaerobacter acetigenes]SHH42404.1 flagellar protein FlgJ [Sporanaerobacter acetigenes DSM 13106]
MEILPNDFITRRTPDESILERKIEGAKETNKDEELMNVCKDFETIFIHMTMKEMRKTIPEDGFIEKSTATKIFEDMFDEQISNEVAKKGEGIGLAKMLYEQFKRQNVNY